ncbi:MAG: 3-hydroxyacyl-[acyl-carrier-protein] dehydratase FabZ [Candidatus Neomarinimicrobiota bacterium]|nr:MAG: 3-hydroxyacyl-[acyl-carrier-protein] dehydratase FabZ [Candidatus Neomarinimicrobiota bacterium]
MKLNKEQIKEIIPHRDPFLLVDRVLELEPGDIAICEKDVRIDEYYFKGHFPEEPVMPGVLIIESIAQTGAITLLSLPENKGKIVYFGGLKKAKFKRKVIPGDTLRLEVKINKIKKSFGDGFGRAYVGNELACEAEFIFSYMDKP